MYQNLISTPLDFKHGQITVQTPQHYQAIKVLNEGVQGLVFEAVDLPHSKRLAIKKMKNIHSDPVEIQKCVREFLLGASVRHKNIIRVIDAYTPQKQWSELQDLYLVFDHMDCDLAQLNRQRRDLFEGQQGGNIVAHLIRQLLCAVRHLHQEKFRLIHRDIKPANILVRYNYDLKLADLGCARRLPPPDKETMSEYIVTRPYRAPEIILSGKENYERPVDLWSVGCVLAELMINHIIFAEKDQVNLIYKIMRIIGLTEAEIETLPHYVKNNVKNKRQNFSTHHLESFLKKDTPNWANWIDNFVFLTQRLLTFNPAERITAEEALALPFWSACGNGSDLDEGTEVVNFEEHKTWSTDQWKQALFNAVIIFQFKSQP